MKDFNYLLLGFYFLLEVGIMDSFLLMKKQIFIKYIIYKIEYIKILGLFIRKMFIFCF